MEQEFNADAIPTTGQEAEALIQHFESPEEEQTEGATEVPAKPTPAETYYALNYKGQEEKHPLSKILEFASQGRDYSQKMRDLRVQRELFEKDRSKYADIDARLQKYAEVEAYIQKDPAWWQHVQGLYQQRAEGQGTATPQLPPEVLAKLDETSKYVESMKIRHEDESLDSDIRTYQEKNPQFDWGKVDESGRPDLERRILDHAIQNGIKSFRAAANDFLFEEHVNRAKTAAKEDVGKQIQKQTKLGLGPVTPKPVLKLKGVANIRDKSWDEVTREALAEAGIA